MDQQSLLRWGIENSSPGSLVPLHEDMKAGRRPDLNSDMLKAIMGTTDADRIKECVMVIQGKWVDRDGGGVKDGEVRREDRIRAWDDLEMLIQDLDNANDLKFLGLWPPIVERLTDADEDIAMRACWVCGTAVQNNPKAQSAFLELDPLPILLSLLTSPTHPPSTRNKAMYALSSTLKHSPSAVEKFTSLNGWGALHQCLQDPSPTLRTKTAFLLSQLCTQTSPSDLLPLLRSSSLLPLLLSSLSPSSSIPTGPNGDQVEVDVDYREKALRVLVNLVEAIRDEGKTGAAGFTAAEKERGRAVVSVLEEESGWDVDMVGLAKEEWDAFKTGLQSV